MVGIIEADYDKLACYNNVSLTYAGFAVKSNLLEHAETC